MLKDCVLTINRPIFPGTLGDEVTNFGGAQSQSQKMKSNKRKSTPKKKGGGKKRKFV